MGIFRDLVSNYANSKMQEEQHKLAYNLGLGEILTTLIKNPETDPATYSKASAFYQDLLAKHGGKEGKLLQGQIAQFLTGYGQARMKDRGEQGPTAGAQQPTPPGGTQPQQGEPIVAPGGGMPAEQPLPPGQTPGQPGGVNYGWPTSGTPATLAGTGDTTPQQPAQAQRGGLGRVLGGLAGVGKEMLGVPRPQGGMLIPTKEQINRVYGPTAVGAAKEKEGADLAALQMGRSAYFKQQDDDVKSGLISADEAKQNKAEFDRLERPPTTTRSAGRVSVAEEQYEDALQAKADELTKQRGKKVAVKDLTAQEKLDATREAKPKSVAVQADEDALQAKADKLSKQRGTPVLVKDLTASEKIDGRMEAKKQIAAMGEMLDPTELEHLVRYDLLTGKTTNFGMSANSPNRVAYQRMRAHVLATEGPRSFAEQSAALRADSGSLSSLVRMTDAINAWEANAKLNLDQARQLSAQAGRTGSTLANEYIQWAQGKLEDYPLLAKFRVAVETGAAEYTKVMYSATPSGGTAKDQRDSSHSMLSTAMSEGTLNAAIEQMNVDMRNRHDTLNAQIDYTKGRIREGEGGGGGGDKRPETVHHPKNKAEYDALPPGAQYQKPGDSNTYRKKK